MSIELIRKEFNRLLNEDYKNSKKETKFKKPNNNNPKQQKLCI